MLSKHKNATVEFMLTVWVLAKEGTTLHWRRTIRGWECDNLELLNNWMHNKTTNSKQDHITWGVNNSVYNTNQDYKLIEACQGIDNESQILWKIKIPPKVHIFLWKIMHDFTPTLTLLNNRGMQINTKFKICGLAEENSEHLFGRARWQITAGNSFIHGIKYQVFSVTT